MTGYLIDTNVVSELRKGQRADAGVRRWIADCDGDAMYLSVLTAGELRRGVERVRRRDAEGAMALQRWLANPLETYADRMLPVDLDVADTWGTLGVPDPLPVIDGLLAATARCHGLTVVTRDEEHFRLAGAAVVNPFDG